jgi:alpha-L-rhamnosidase
MTSQTQHLEPNTTQTVTVAKPSLEHQPELLGIAQATPRLSWIVQTDRQDWLQAAFEIEVSRADQTQTSGRIEVAQSVLQPWSFAPLQSREHVRLRVRVWGQDGSSSDWSESLAFELGLLETSDWTARFITPDWQEDISKPQPSPLLRQKFELKPRVKSARLYVTALGVYEAFINGTRIGNHVLAPGWTSYDHRIRYQTFDVTHLLCDGQNAIGAMIGDGWYRGQLGFNGGQRNVYGDKLGLLAQLEIEYQDGTTERIVTDHSWRSNTGAILKSDIYDGEFYDARLEQHGWNTADFDDSSWSGVKILERDLSKLESPLSSPVRQIEEVAAVSISTSPSGKTLVDFGQNLVGWVRLSVQGVAGQTITLRHAEVLEHNELGTRPLRHAAQTDLYILRGAELEVWQPRFTFHGFRYVEISGYPNELKLEHLVAVVLHSDLERTGWFECSDPLVNQLHKNIVWGMRGNFLDVPTDCPQRDERLGWTGDIQVFAPTASFLFDCAGFLESWLRDLAAEQSKDGVVPFTIPNVLGVGGIMPMTAWGDAAVIVPWVLYQRFNDPGILEAQFESMKAWVDHLERITQPSLLWDKGPQFGDWLDPSAPPENPGAAKTPSSVVATAYFVRSAELLGQAARVLGKDIESKHYLELASKVCAAFVGEYVTPNGRILGDATTAYALALEFELLLEPQRERAQKRLLELVRDDGYRISTGFVGTPLVCDALCKAGAFEAAFRLLLQRHCPSWLYPVTMGATTIWERWDSMLPDGSINSGEMTSFNHYALGAVADWLHRSVAGLAPAAPGYKKLEIRPILGGNFTHARASHITPYGLASVAWKIENNQFELELTVPANTSASVFLPASTTPFEVGSGSHRWIQAYNPPIIQRLKPTLDTTEGELLDDPEAYAVVLETVRQHNPTAVTSEDRLRHGGSSISLRQITGFMPNSLELQEKLEQVLTDLMR